jgi:hypothetical protein
VKAQPIVEVFKELSVEELGKLPLAEQLQYQRKLNEWKKQ